MAMDQSALGIGRKGLGGGKTVASAPVAKGTKPLKGMSDGIPKGPKWKASKTAKAMESGPENTKVPRGLKGPQL